MRDKPDACYTSGCPLAVTCGCGHHIDLHQEESNCTYVDGHDVPCKCTVFKSKGRGFVLGTGSPSKAKYAFIFEAPGKDELGFRIQPVAGRTFLGDQASVNAELAERERAYPGLDRRFTRVGAPIVGATGVELEMWGFPKSGINRGELFIDNTLRCLPPKSKQGAYPTGEDRKEAEKCCRMWDRFEEFKPDVALVTLHPAGIMREITPLPLQIADLTRAKDFAESGLKVMVLNGGKASHAFLRYAENVTKWRGHYEFLPSDWAATYKAAFEFKKKVKKKPGPKVGAAKVKKLRESFATLDHLFDVAGGALPAPTGFRKPRKLKPLV